MADTPTIQLTRPFVVEVMIFSIRSLIPTTESGRARDPGSWPDSRAALSACWGRLFRLAVLFVSTDRFLTCFLVPMATTDLSGLAGAGQQWAVRRRSDDRYRGR